MKKLVLAVSSAFGLGYSPFAPGTCGALLGIPLALALTVLHGNIWLQIFIAWTLTLLAIPICDAAEKIYGVKDDGRIVADEYMLLPICFIGHAPLWSMIKSGGSTAMHAWLFVGIVFVISRIVDILKPTPARQIQIVKGGMGIVLDDLVASLYTWIFAWGLKGYILVSQ